MSIEGDGRSAEEMNGYENSAYVANKISQWEREDSRRLTTYLIFMRAY